MAALRYELLPEDETTEHQRRLAGELLYESFGEETAGGRGWNRRAPSYRVLVWDGETLVGCEHGCLVGCSPPLVVYGFSDASVRDGWRGLGIAREMGKRVLAEANRRDADAAICETDALGELVVDLGMTPVQPGELYLETGEGPTPLVDGWYVVWLGAEPVPLTIDGLI